jgi:hypothetical protein
MKYFALVLFSLLLKFSFGQKMDKMFISKKSGDTTWRTKMEALFKKKKLLVDESTLTVFSYKISSSIQPKLWFNGSMYARVIFEVKKRDKLEITFTDGTKDSLFAEDDQKSGVAPFNDKQTDWFSVYVLSQENITNLTTKDISFLSIKAGPFHFSFPLEPEKKDIIKNQLNLLLSSVNK